MSFHCFYNISQRITDAIFFLLPEKKRKDLRKISLMRDASETRAYARWTLPFERHNVIFPAFLIARDVISNSRQSAEIYRRYLTWFRFIVHRVVRRGVICDHNFPLNVTLDACAESWPPPFFFSFFASSRVPPISRRPRSRVSLPPLRGR